MAKSVGVTLSERIRRGWWWITSWWGPATVSRGMTTKATRWWRCMTDALVDTLCEQIVAVADGEQRHCCGRRCAARAWCKNGVVEDAPNLPQLKGARIRDLISRAAAAARHRRAGDAS